MASQGHSCGECTSQSKPHFRMLSLIVSVVVLGLNSIPAWSIQLPKPSSSPLAQKEFSKPELHVSSVSEPSNNVKHLMPNAQTKAHVRFTQQHGTDFHFHIDPRSATPTNIIGHIPFIPGSAKDNHIKFEHVSQALGRSVTSIDAETVSQLIRKFIHDNLDILNIDESQIGETHAEQVTDHLWQIHLTQKVDGIKVRHSRLNATISHGNLVMIGTERWGKVTVKTKPAIEADEALKVGFQYAGGQLPDDQILSKPILEIVPFAPLHLQDGDRYTGPLGQGYDHRLVWTFTFKRPPESATWEVMIDAQTGEIQAFKDINHYATENITGGIYPLASTEVCPANDRCGVMQLDHPMPFADTGLAAPNDFTNSAGLFDYTAGNILTTLFGKYVHIQDTCGLISENPTGSSGINLGGSNGQHDCSYGGSSTGNTAAARSSFYELNKIQEMARGYLPTTSWLQRTLGVNVNLIDPDGYYCNAYWDGITINLYRSGGGCRNAGEIPAIFDHEWAHGLDNNLHGGGYSSPSESFADIATIYRSQTSCLGYGFLSTQDQGCGQTSDGTGYNANEAQMSYHCDLNCSGTRDADWDQHSDHTPDTPANFVCTQCIDGSYGHYELGPCGREVHCEAAVDRQAAWDFAARDLQGAPFNYDSTTAFIIANKLFYQGSGNIGDWHTCSCASSTSNGCGATNAYMQWLAADDDDGDINNGTPHMTALYNAFNRHGLACDTPAPTNSGCSGAPAEAPVLTTTPGNNQVGLSWTSVPGATKYWVFRTEGYAGCGSGKTLIATVTGETVYTDTGLANGRQYCYSVMAVGSSDACFGTAGACTCATPDPGPHGILQGTVTGAANGNPISGAIVTATGGYWTTTNGSGGYQFTALPLGTYDLTVSSAYGYPTQTVTGIVITDGVTVTRNIALNPLSFATIQGTVTDGSGHGWPLYAKIDITAPGYSTTIYTDPMTGNYSISLNLETLYTLNVSSAGYNSTTRNITPPSGGSTENFALTVTVSPCTAPGYGIGSYSETFEFNDGGFSASGNTSWAWGKPTSGPGSAHSGAYVWGTNLSGNYNNNENGYLTSPVIDLSANAGQSSTLSWWQWLQSELGFDHGSVEVSNNGGASWTTVYGAADGNVDLAWARHAVVLGPSYSVSTFRVRFHFTSDNSEVRLGWYIDDVSIIPDSAQQDSCLPQPGGLVVGNVYNAATAVAINNASVTDDLGHTATTKATPHDPALEDGFFTLFLPAGSVTLTASYPGLEEIKTINVVADSVIRQNFNLANEGKLQGTVTNSATGNPISGATVTATGGHSTTTNSYGFYQFVGMPSDVYDVTVTHYGYQAQTITGVAVSGGITTTQNSALNPLLVVTVHGTVTDGSGHGWPLYAKIDITATGYSNTIYTDPVTGNYSINLYQGTPYAFSVTSSGYNSTTRNITPPAEGSAENFALTVSSCAEPGYRGGISAGSFYAAGWTSKQNSSTDIEYISPPLDFTGFATVGLEFDTNSNICILELLTQM